MFAARRRPLPLLRRVSSFFSLRGTMAAQLIASSFAINTLMLAMPIMTLQIYDRIMTNKHGGTLAMLSIGIIACIAAEMALRAARSYLFSYAASAFEYRRIRHIMHRIARAQTLPALKKASGE